MYVLLAFILLQVTSPSVQPKQPVVKKGTSSSAHNASATNSKSKLPPAESQNAGVPSTPQATPQESNKEQKPTERIYKVDVVSPPAKPLDTPLFPIYLLFTGIGVFVNGWVAFLVYRQTKLNWHQVRASIVAARAATKSARAAKESADAARDNVSSLEKQLTEMQKAREQTDKLIVQSESTAAATRDSADALVASERAWVQIEIYTREKLSTMYWPPSFSCFSVWPQFKNYGRTPARITKIFATAIQVTKAEGFPPDRPADLPAEPDYSRTPWSSIIERDAILPPESGITPINVNVSIPDFEDTKKWKSSLYVYGYVDYFDVVGKPHQTRFCELYWIPHDIRDPVAEGFMTSVFTPAAYTEST